jgi:hypothetical protein
LTTKLAGGMLVDRVVIQEDQTQGEMITGYVVREEVGGSVR